MDPRIIPRDDQPLVDSHGQVEYSTWYRFLRNLQDTAPTAGGLVQSGAIEEQRRQTNIEADTRDAIDLPHTEYNFETRLAL